MKILSRVLLGAAMAFAVVPAAAQVGGDESKKNQLELNLVVGENKTISAEGVKNYSEGIRGIADIKLTTDEKRFVVAGRKPGSTTLLLINRDGSTKTWVINVFKRSPEAVKRELSQLLGEMPGIRVRRVGSRFFIEGGVGTDERRQTG